MLISLQIFYLYAMAILRFRTYWEEDESVYRDISIQHKQNFADLHEGILKAFEFDNKHQACFYRSNDAWQKGRAIALEKYDAVYKVEPLIMEEVLMGSEIKDPNQKFLYDYDFNKNWHFRVELIQVDKVEEEKLDYPACVRKEGMAPSQYGTKGLIDKRLAEMEEKYDLKEKSLEDGFGNEGEEGEEEDIVDEDTADEEL